MNWARFGAWVVYAFGLAIVVALAGCAEGEDGFGMQAGTGGVEGTGGSEQGTGGSSGTGGMTVPDVQPITEADALSCEPWPLCPEGIFSFQNDYPGTTARVDMHCPQNRTCRLCRDTRVAGQCTAFVGKCRAPVSLAQNGCENKPGDVTNTYYYCTGSELIEPVCAGAPWPT